MCAPSNQQMHAFEVALTNHACRSRHRQKVTLHRKVGWSGISFSVSKQSASGQRHAIKDMPVFCAHARYLWQADKLSGSPHRQKVTLHRKKPSKTLRFEHGGRVTDGRGQLDFPDHASVHLEPPGYYIPLWGNKKLVSKVAHPSLQTSLL